MNEDPFGGVLQLYVGFSLQHHMDSSRSENPFQSREPITLGGTIIGYLTFELDTRSITQAISSIQHQGTTIATAEIVLSILLLTLLGVTITRNLSNLTTAVASLSPAGQTFDVSIDSKDEVSGLALAFKEMTQKLRQREQERDEAARATQASDARYKRLVENLSSEYFFYSHDLDGVFFYVSESITDVLGYTQSEFLSHYKTYLTDNPINNNLISRDDQQNGRRRPPFIISIYHKDGSERFLFVLCFI